jgi:hypothetical protein
MYCITNYVHTIQKFKNKSEFSRGQSSLFENSCKQYMKELNRMK